MVTETINGLKLLKGTEGYESLFIDSSRIDDCVEYLHANNLKHISINSFQGYKAKDLNFLAGLKNYLEGISIPENHYDFAIVNELHKLKSLGIPDNKKDNINLASFPKLERLATDFSERLIGLAKCSNLKSLTLSNYKSETQNVSALPPLNALEDLFLIQPKIVSLKGVEIFKSLKRLSLFKASKLEFIAEIQNLSASLTEIEFEKCKKISDYEILEKLTALQRLLLSESGEIKNISFIKSLPHLRFFSFWGTNVLDGDLSYCEGIAYVGFDNKKHYSHKSQHFKGGTA